MSVLEAWPRLSSNPDAGIMCERFRPAAGRPVGGIMATSERVLNRQRVCSEALLDPITEINHSGLAPAAAARDHLPTCSPPLPQDR